MLRAPLAGFVGCWLVACSYHRGLPLDPACSRRDRECDRGGQLADAGVSSRSGSGSIATGVAGLPLPSGKPGGVIAEPADDARRAIFDDNFVKTYEVTVAPEDLAAIDARPSSETYVPASLTIDGEHVDNVGL